MFKKSYVKDYIDFQSGCQTPYHAVQTIKALCLQKKFEELKPENEWQVKPRTPYYIPHPDGKSCILAFLGNDCPTQTGFQIFGAHTDSPNLRFKTNPFTESSGTVHVLTQYHGGAIFRSWLDRPLCVAGAVYKRSSGVKKSIERVLVKSSRPVAYIPDLAIHLDRDKNKIGEVNPEKHLKAVLASGSDIKKAVRQLSRELKIELDRAVGFDLQFSPHASHQIAGVDDSLIVGPRHDDLAMVYCGLEGFLNSLTLKFGPSHSIIAAFFDSEETGSQTSSGADSSFLRDSLKRLCKQHPEFNLKMNVQQAFSRSLVLSADMAHALHPSHMDKHDLNHAPLINEGVVIKTNSNDRYATTGETESIFKVICKEANVPFQNFVNRQDMGCGSTIGPMTSAHLSARTLDVGTAQWGMHSTNETMGAKDLTYAIRSFSKFFELQVPVNS